MGGTANRLLRGNQLNNYGNFKVKCKIKSKKA